MNTHFTELIDGEFEYEVPHLILSEEAIVRKEKENGKIRGKLRIGSEDGRQLAGQITSDHQRILLSAYRFSGKDKQIEYGIDLTGMHAGEVLKGSICVTTDLEEKIIPVQVEIQNDQLTSSRGTVTSLNEFTHLASGNFREAFSLFTSPAFVRLLEGKNSRYLSLYQGLSRTPVTYQHLEEFLVAAGRKDPVTISLDKEEKEYNNPGRTMKDTLYVTRSTWGNLHLEVEVLGDFLEVTRKVISTDDFIGSTYGLEYILHLEDLSEGRHFGKILVHNAVETVECRIELMLPAREDPEKALRIQTLELELKENYLNLLTHLTNYPRWLATSWDQINALKDLGVEDTWLYLWQVLLHDYAEESGKCREVMGEIARKNIPLSTPEEKGLYLFYANRYASNGGGNELLLDRLTMLANMEPASWLLQHLLFQTDEMRRTPSRMLHTFEQLFELGNNSPFLYAEAARVLLGQAGQLRRLTPFMIRVLLFIQKKKMLTPAILSRAAYLSGSMKGYQKDLCRFLMRGYEQFPDDSVLEAVCRQLMLGRTGSAENFIWYQRAVDHKLRITRLYEHYAETLSPHYEGMLPQAVRMYFGYQNTLSSRKKAQIYANIVRYEKEDPDTWRVYKDTIERFVGEQLKTGRIDKEYATLYRRFMKKPENAEEAQNLARILFTVKLTCKSPKIRRVIVRNGILVKEKSYQLENGTAYLQLYSPESEIFLEDEKRRRFAVTVPYEKEMLLADGEIARACGAFLPKSPGLLLYLCHEKESQMKLDQKNYEWYVRAASEEAFTSEYRNVIRRKLLGWYLDHSGETSMEDAVRLMEDEVFARVSKADTIQVLVEYGHFERAFHLVDEYGCEEIPARTLLRLVTNMLRIRNYEPSEELLCLAVECWKQRSYDEAVLNYLADYYNGSCQLLSELWKDGRGFHLEQEKLEEKLLGQILASRSWPEAFPEILEHYIRKSGKEELILPAMIYASYGYFLDGKMLTPRLFHYLEELNDPSWETPEICGLALLKFYSELEELSDSRRNMARRKVDYFIHRGYRFAHWQRLPESVISAYQLKNPVFIEARFPFGSSVLLHYRSGEGEWKEEPMREMYSGIYNREFLLFYGESLEYYLSVTRPGQEEAVETTKRSVTVDEIVSAQKTRYSLINEGIAARSLGNTPALEQAAKEYVWRNALVQSAFELIG